MLKDTDFAAAGFLLALCSSVILLLLVRRQQRRMQQFEEQLKDISSVPFEKVTDRTPEDEEAYRIIEEERKNIWNDFSETASLSTEKLMALVGKVTGSIASVYFPENAEPVNQATVEGLVHLIRRVCERLEFCMNTFPLTFLKERTIGDILRVHQGYKKVKNNQLVRFFSNTYVDAARRLLWFGVNAANPWYYGRQIIWSAGKEAAVRYLLTLIVTIAGEEAVLLYRKSKK